MESTDANGGPYITIKQVGVCLHALAIQQGRDLVTLVTCTPYGINTKRLYVHGERVWVDQEESVEVEGNHWSFAVWFRKYWWILLEIGLGALLAWNVSYMVRQDRKRK